MSKKYVIDEQTLSDIAKAIRAKLQITDEILVKDFASRILSIEALIDYYLTRIAKDTVYSTIEIPNTIELIQNISERVSSALYKENALPRQHIVDTVSGVTLRGLSVSCGVSDGIASAKTYEHSEIIDTSKQAEYTFDKKYVTYDDTFKLKSEYVYTSSLQEIDSGLLCSVTIQTDDKASVEGVTIE